MLLSVQAEGVLDLLMEAHPDAVKELSGVGQTRETCLRISLVPIVVSVDPPHDVDGDIDGDGIVDGRHDGEQTGEADVDIDDDNDGIVTMAERKRHQHQKSDLADMGVTAMKEGGKWLLKEIGMDGIHSDGLDKVQAMMNIDTEGVDHYRSVKVVKQLLAADPSASSKEDVDGRLPLHLCLILGAPEDITTAVCLDRPGWCRP